MNKFTLWLNKKRTVLYLMIIAFIIRAGFGIMLGQRFLPMADQIVFDELARNIVSGKGLMITDRLIVPPDTMGEAGRALYAVRPERIRDMRLNALWGIIQPGKPTAFIEPMVPLTFAAIYKIFGPSIIPPRVFQALLEALVVGMIFSIGVMAFPKSRASGIAALIYTFYPFTIMFSAAMNTQPVYLFLQCASVYLFYKFMLKPGWFYAVLFGLFFGMTVLARISIITFAPFFLLALLLQDYNKPKWGLAAFSLILAGLLLVPWVVRNEKAFGEPLLLPTKGGRNLWEYNNQLFSREKINPSEDEFEGVDILYYRFARKHIDRIQGRQYIEFPEFTDENEIERDKILNHNVMQFISLNPKIFVQLCFYRFYQFFRIFPSHQQHLFFKAAAILSFGWILPLSILGGYLLLKHWRKLALVYLLILYNIGVHTLTASGIPHRLPLDPFFILFAAYSIHRAFIIFNVIKETKEEPKL